MLIYIGTNKYFPNSEYPEVVFEPIVDDFELMCNKLELNEDDVLLINSEMLLDNHSTHSDLNGVLFLKWLRIYHRCLNKIVISGFMPLHQIIRTNPEHVILMAKGNTYLQYPFSRKQLDTAIKKTDIIKEEELVRIYRPFVKPDFYIDEIAHDFANEFGLFLMLLVHEEINGYKISSDHLRKNNALNFEKAIFLYFSDIDRHQLSNEEEALIENLLLVTVDSSTKPPKILYIDDQAESGWKKLFAGMIYNDSGSSDFLTIPKKDVFNSREIDNYIRIYEPSCVLLDLRLKGDDEDTIPIEKISGFKILSYIKNHYPSLPVIITSATNKADNLSALLKAGAEGLWTKPRVETIDTSSQLYGFYFDFLSLVYNALTKFKTPLEKTIFELDFHLNQCPSKYYMPNLESSIFIFDTNYFVCNSNNYNDFKNRLKAFISLHNLLREKKCKKRIYVVDDVLSELNRLAIGAKKLDSEDATEVKISATYSKNLLTDLINSDSDVMSYDYLLERILKNEHITYKIVGENKSSLYIQQNILIDKFQNLQDAKNAKEKLIELNKKTTLHADDTLKFYVSHLFLNVNKNAEITNFYLVSNDFGCNYNTYRYVVGNDSYQVRDIDKQVDIWENNNRYNLKRAALYFEHHQNQKRRLYIHDSAEFINTFGNLKELL